MCSCVSLCARRSLDTVTSSPYADLAANPNMVGLGITPEAIDQDMRDFDAFCACGGGGRVTAAPRQLMPARALAACNRSQGRPRGVRPPQTRQRGSRCAPKAPRPLRSCYEGPRAQNYAVRRYGAASPSVSAAYAILQGAAFNAGIDTAALEVRPGLGTRMSQNTNATGILEVRRVR